MNLKQILKQKIKALFEVWPILLVRAYLRDSKGQREIWSDYLRTFRQARFLRRTKFNLDRDKLVLIPCLIDWVFKIKLEAMFAIGLKQRGWTPLILTSRYCPWVHMYLRSFGIDNFVYIEDMPLSSGDMKNADREVEDYLSKPRTFAEIRDWEYRGAAIGGALLFKFMKMNELTLPDLTSQKSRKQMSTIMTGMIRRLHRMKALLGRIKPQLVLIPDLNDYMTAPLIDMSINDDIDVATYYLIEDNMLGFKKVNRHTRSMHPHSLTHTELESLQSIEWGDRDNDINSIFEKRYGDRLFFHRLNQNNVRKKTTTEIIEQLDLNPDKKTAAIFSQIFWDTNIFSGKDLFPEYIEWFIETMRAAVKNDRVNWIIKLHPANLWRMARQEKCHGLIEIAMINKHIGKLPKHVRLLHPDTDISSFSLFKAIDYGVTIKGTIGIELPCLGIPVVTAGTGRYSGHGFTIDSVSRDEYLDKLSHIQDISRLTEQQIMRAKWHFLALFKLNVWQMKSFQTAFDFPAKGTRPLDYNISLNASSWASINHNGDLKKWGEWAESPHRPNYLDRDVV